MAKKKKASSKGASAKKASTPRRKRAGSGRVKASGGVPLPKVLLYYTKGLAPYAIALQKAGILSGPAGKQSLAPEVKQLVEALHIVLAGGAVTSLNVSSDGANEATRVELDRDLGRAIRATNVIHDGRVDVFYG